MGVAAAQPCKCLTGSRAWTVVEFRGSPLAFPGENPGLFLHFEAETGFSARRVEMVPFGSARGEVLPAGCGVFDKDPKPEQQ